MRPPVQLQLDLTSPRGDRRGGKRKGAGRKRVHPRKRVRHVPRAETCSRYPVHVTVRVRPHVRRLRNFKLCKVLREAFVKGCRKPGFRICQFSIQGNHIHMICEAENTQRLARGVQGWEIRVAKALNKISGCKGAVFDDRYDAKVMTSPRQTRNVLCYVMQNARRHRETLDPRWGGIDPFTSAWYFDGWKDDGWREVTGPPKDESPPVAKARSWLLTVGWRRHGLIGVTEVPAAARS